MLAVVHFGFSHKVDGGFIGVDVFFVILGYVITGIVQRNIEAGRFSLKQLRPARPFSVQLPARLP